MLNEEKILALVKGFEFCHQLCYLLQQWKFNEATELINHASSSCTNCYSLKLSTSSLSPSSWPFLLLPPSAQVQADDDGKEEDNGCGSREERLSDSTTSINITSIFQLPFYHFKFGSLHSLANLAVLILDEDDNDDDTANATNENEASNKRKLISSSLKEIVWKLQYWGFDALAESIIHKWKVLSKNMSNSSNQGEYIEQSLLHELLFENGNAKSFCQSSFYNDNDKIQIMPISLLQQDQDIKELLSLYITFTTYMKQKQWINALQFIQQYPIIYYTPYFWSETDEKTTVLDLAFGNHAPLHVKHELIQLGGITCIHGAFSAMFKIFPFHRACCFTIQPLDIIDQMVDVAGDDILHSLDCTGYENTNRVGETPLQMTLRFNRTMNEKKNHTSIEIIQYLVHKGGMRALQKTNELGETVFMITIKYQHSIQILQSMVEVGGIDALLHDTTHTLHTPLHVAIRYSSMETIQFLLNYVHDKKYVLQAYTINMETPLLSALYEEKLDVAQYLIGLTSEEHNLIDIASLFKIGQEIYESLMCIYMTNANSVSYDVIQFILQHCDLSEIINVLFGIFTISKETKKMQRRVYDDLIKHYGLDETWALIMPYLQQYHDQVSPILHSALETLARKPISLLFTDSNGHMMPNEISPFLDTSGNESLIRTCDITAKTRSILQEIIERFPNSTSILDERNQLPIHLAAVLGFQYNDLIPIIEMNQSALQQKDPFTGLYTFALAATAPEYNCDLDTIYLILQNNPSVISEYI